MKTKTIDEQPRTIAVVFEKGDEVVEGLEKAARENRVASGHFTGIGALSDVLMAFFDWETKQYLQIPIPQQVEVLSLVGNVAIKEGDAQIHAHMVIGKRDGTTFGGHLLEAHVRPTLEVIIVQSSKELQRENDPESGLALIRL